MRVAFNKQKYDNGLNNSIVDRQHSSTTGSVVDYNKQITVLLHFLKVNLHAFEQANGGNEWNRRDKRTYHNNVDKARNNQFTAAGLFTNAKQYVVYFVKRYLIQQRTAIVF